jgi:hypothetical protein
MGASLVRGTLGAPGGEVEREDSPWERTAWGHAPAQWHHPWRDHRRRWVGRRSACRGAPDGSRRARALKSGVKGDSPMNDIGPPG